MEPPRQLQHSPTRILLFPRHWGLARARMDTAPCVPTAAFGTEPCRHCCPGRDLIPSTFPGHAAGPPSSKRVPSSAPVLGVTSHRKGNPTPEHKAKLLSQASITLRAGSTGARPGFSELHPAGTWLGPGVVLGLFSLVLWPSRKNPKHSLSLAWEAAAVSAPGKPHERRSGSDPRASSATLC